LSRIEDVHYTANETVADNLHREDSARISRRLFAMVGVLAGAALFAVPAFFTADAELLSSIAETANSRPIKPGRSTCFAH
jgi:VIT1/CCC1 family predicted Fe2+/Mn2+ transporter